jgi:hypothetical protein
MCTLGSKWCGVKQTAAAWLEFTTKLTSSLVGIASVAILFRSHSSIAAFSASRSASVLMVEVDCCRTVVSGVFHSVYSTNKRAIGRKQISHFKKINSTRWHHFKSKMECNKPGTAL